MEFTIEFIRSEEETTTIIFVRSFFLEDHL